MEPSDLFKRAWNCVYKIIGGETKFKNNFNFITGDALTARKNKGKITFQFCDISTLGGNGIIGRTGYLNGRPRFLQLANLKNTSVPVVDYLHNYAHELVHVALTNCQKGSIGISSNSENNVSCNMFSENLADLFADLGLHTFDSEFKNNLSVNTMLSTPYNHWAINSGIFKSGYSDTAELTQLMILAFQNEYIDYNDLVSKKNIGLCIPITLSNGPYTNDFLYGMAFDEKHIEKVWNNFMEDTISYRNFVEKCDDLILNRHNLNRREIQAKKINIMNDIATFANIKNKSNLQSCVITKETNERLKMDFNNLWNGIIKDLENEGPSFDD